MIRKCRTRAFLAVQHFGRLSAEQLVDVLLLGTVHLGQLAVASLAIGPRSLALPLALRLLLSALALQLLLRVLRHRSCCFGFSFSP